MITSIALSGCKKDIDKVLEANGTIKNTGDLAADGCGWIIIINSQTYNPDNLADALKTDNTNVHVRYTLTGTKFSCSLQGNAMSSIHLSSITKNN